MYKGCKRLWHPLAGVGDKEWTYKRSRDILGPNNRLANLNKSEVKAIGNPLPLTSLFAFLLSRTDRYLVRVAPSIKKPIRIFRTSEIIPTWLIQV